MIHSFLMVGQSNMAGRGFLKDVPPICNERIKMLRNGRWQIMTEPINYDRPFSGVGLAASFAAAWCQKHKNEEIGLIPCADGGTSLDDWAVGGVLFEHAVFQAKIAQRTSVLDGILWHQGENECSPELSSRYYEKFLLIVEAFRHELSVPNIPLIMGGLGDYLSSGMFGEYFQVYPLVNKELENFSNSQKNCYFVTASGLQANPDGIHMNAVSQRIFGLRYFEAFDKLKHILMPLEGENSAVNIDSERPLSKAERITLLENKFVKGDLSLEAYQAQLAKINSQM
ncbi:sialate O-acetylesterase [Desulfosporosinus sp. Sb-LF]|uniref:sialate O-acetylesterase n=1 Tax=Desulfosporosinus sp. Sb-LF TaxID=2560027 RepID=UPI00107F947D|nr:sialate O-acetylesterase [Desulfosporosinus sp. Sb-LF]TGE34498.1 sialate O-acetylesterase [Desulfosporosinus sp. Sb-LF]